MGLLHGLVRPLQISNTLAVATDGGHPWRTEPSIVSQILDVQQITHEPSLLAPGYLFTAPETFTDGWGPKIYSTDGMLIWDDHSTQDAIKRQFHVCDYAGQHGTHLCWHEASALGPERNGEGARDIRGGHRVVDNSYSAAGLNYSSTGPELAAAGNVPDSHEFHLVDNGEAFLQLIYARKPMDLRPWTGPEDGWIKDGCFQEVSVQTGEPTFTWCWLDHLPLQTRIWVQSETQTNFSSDLGGDGTYTRAWDFIHPNSVDKNEEGDYLLCMRHNDMVMKIAGPHSLNSPPGEVLWRLGGDESDFKMESFTFARQHHARYVSTTADTTVITLFDNAWEGESPKTPEMVSSGKLISINNATKTATLIQDYPHPEAKLSRSGGSAQLLPNGNMLVGWGFVRDVTEFHPNGTVLFHARLGNGDGTGSIDYRNYKYPWVGVPSTEPKLLAYTQSCDAGFPSTLYAYVSWNGATEVAQWHFQVSDSSEGPWTDAGTYDKTDFEVKADLGLDFRAYVTVEALDHDGDVLSQTSSVTFVSSDEASQGCDDYGCFDKQYLDYDERYSYAAQCARPRSSIPRPTFTILVLCMIFVSLLLYRFCWIWRDTSDYQELPTMYKQKM